MIDHVENENAQEHYISPNYNWQEDPRTPKWIIEIDEMIITNLEGKKLERTIQLLASRLYKMFFWQQDSGGAMSYFYALIKDAKHETYAFQIEDLWQ